ncbi:type II toxin-antitoxin system HicB family antitoxin [Metabacillus fastidiosus]|uniref:type II toxin-antitoxin system HicB family antitoxin n=1 Tax=Metabacillus fastidiosus TaxID=1458 RepID=UPI003D2E9AF4
MDKSKLNKKDRYMYPAIFDFAEDGISVEFPDLPGCLTCGDNQEDALMMAKEALSLHLYGLEVDGDNIPDPSPLTNLNVQPNQVVVIIDAWMPPFRHEMENKAVKKTLTIPKWLDDHATQHKINFSKVLQDALKEILGVDKHRL